MGLAAAAGASLGAVWVLRAPLAGAALTNYLAQRGVEAAFTIDRLDLAGASLSAVRLGPDDAPAAMIERVELSYDLGGVSAVRLIGPRLRFSASEAGLSFGALDRLFAGPPRARRPLPDWRIEIIGGEALGDTPFGALPVTFEARGRLGHDFAGAARLTRAAAQGPGGRFAGASGVLTARSTPQGSEARLEIGAARVVLSGVAIAGLSARGVVQAPNDLGRAEATASWRVDALDGAVAAGSGLVGDARLSGALGPRGLAFADWRATLHGQAQALQLAGARLAAPTFQGRLRGDDEGGRGDWRLTAGDSAAMGLTAPNLTAAGAARLQLGDAPRLDLDGALAAAQVRQTEAGRAALMRAWPTLGAAPIGPLLLSSRAAALESLAAFSLNAPFTLSMDRDGFGAALPRAFALEARSGAQLRVAPLRPGAPLLSLQSGIWRGGAQIALSGGGLPDATWRVASIQGGGPRPLVARGRLAIADWRAAGAQFAAPSLAATLTLAGARGGLRLAGDARASGPLVGGSVTDLSAPLDLAIAWGDGLRIGTQDNRCVIARFAGLTLPGLSFGQGGVELCPDSDGFFATDARGAASGGFRIANLAFAGHVADAPTQGARMTSGGVVGRISGRAGQIVLDVSADRPALDLRLAANRTLNVRGARLTARTRADGESWSTEGRFEAGALRDEALAGDVTDIAAQWRADPRGREAVVRIVEARARVTDRAPPGAPRERRAAFQPLTLTGVHAEIAAGQVRAEGAIALAAGGRTLGGFELRHDLARGVGAADMSTRDLVFDARLQPFMVTELARGVAENVRGPVLGEAHLAWTPATLTARGRARLENVSLSSTTLPVIEGVSGAVTFDDLFTLRTPPGQTLTIAQLNPGIAVRDGAVRFQLLGDGRVALEDARWPLAGGQVSVAPTTLTLGAEETRVHLALRDVDVALLLQMLNVPDLRATGHVEGDFPLLLTATTALIENGALRTVNGGGRIEYTGRAGESAEGVAALAFGALRAFTYDDLALVLNGDLGGDVITTINFSGRNDAALNLREVTPGNVPTLGGGDIPFRFNVRVTAPFRRLAETAASFGDATSLIERAQPAQPTQPRPDLPIDPARPAPR